LAPVRLALVPIALALVAVLGGCGGGSSQPSGPTPLTLALDFTPNAAHAPIYAAVRTGADRRHGIKLRILGPGAGTPDSLKLVTSGRADVGVLDIHDLGLAAERGADIVGIAALVQRPLAAVIARAGIKRPRGLAGKTVGVTGLPSDVAVLNAVVTGDGGDFSAVKQHTIGFSAVPQMVAGKVDAVTAFWNAEGVVLHTRGVKTDDFRVDRYGAPPYPEVVLFVKRSAVEQRRPQLRALLAALSDGVREVHQHPDAAIKQIADVSGADEPLVKAQLAAVDPLFDPPMRLDRAVLARWASWDTRFGILPRRPKVRRLFDLALAPTQGKAD
jgi:putative hydroxymethylpyrimidine transport system substrate-binding protein